MIATYRRREREKRGEDNNEDLKPKARLLQSILFLSRLALILFSKTDVFLCFCVSARLPAHKIHIPTGFATRNEPTAMMRASEEHAR